MGQSPSSKSYNDEGNGIPFFQGKADFGLHYPTTRIYCSEPNKIANRNDVLISVRAPVGATNIATETCCIGRGLAAISAKASKSYHKYLYYYIKYKQQDIENMGVGSTFKAISRKDLNSISLPLPPLETQKKIADLLDRANDLIEKRQLQIAKLDLLIKSQFIEMFGDPVTNPKGWKTAKLSSIAEIKIGPFGSLLHREDYISSGYALVNPSHIINGKVVVDNDLTISEEKYHELASYALYPNDIVIGRRGEMGRCAVVQQTGLLCGTGSMIIRPKETFKSIILQHILAYPTFKKMINEKAVGVTMLNLNTTIMSNLKIPALPIEMQEAFADFIKKIEAHKSLLQHSLTKLEQSYNSLMQKCFNQEIF